MTDDFIEKFLSRDEEQWIPYFGKKFKKEADRGHFVKKIIYYANQFSKLYYFPDKNKKEIFGLLETIKFLRMGAFMETDNLILSKITEELVTSKEALQELYNDIAVMHNTLQPQFKNVVKNLRDNRMTVTVELTKSLNMMRDVRKFFLEKEHEQEIERLKEFIVLAERLRKLLDDGTLDAVTNIILKLETGENP